MAYATNALCTCCGQRCAAASKNTEGRLMRNAFESLFEQLSSRSRFTLDNAELADSSIRVRNSNSDPNNPSLHWPDPDWPLFRIIEHLNPKGWNALSHETIVTADNQFQGVKVVGDVGGITFVNPNSYEGGLAWVDPYDYSTSERGPYRSNKDIIRGGAYDDFLDGASGNDTIYGNDGRDIIYGGTGDDVLYGGADTDFIFGGDGNDYIEGGTGDDSLNGGNGNDTIYGGDGNDLIVGGAGNNLLKGDEGNDWIIPGSGSNQIWGRDLIPGQPAQIDTVDYSGQTGLSLVYTNNTLNGESLRQVIKANGHYDQLFFIDNVVSDVGMQIIGNDAANNIVGTQGADRIIAGGGNDTIWGGGGNDPILHGGAGDDIIVCSVGGVSAAEGGLGADVLVSPDGDDILTYVNSTTSVVVQLFDQVSGDLYVDNQFVGSGLHIGQGYGSGLESEGDVFYGFATIEGSAFDDTIYGNSQNNNLWGGEGNDTIMGGAGNDSLTGGTGDDWYLFTPGSGEDYIFENAGEGTDVVYLSGISAINMYKEWDHLWIASNNHNDWIYMHRWFTTESVELVYVADYDVYYSVAYLASLAQDITPTGHSLQSVSDLAQSLDGMTDNPTDIFSVPEANSERIALAGTPETSMVDFSIA